jgi:hypothetical protein
MPGGTDHLIGEMEKWLAKDHAAAARWIQTTSYLPQDQKQRLLATQPSP